MSQGIEFNRLMLDMRAMQMDAMAQPKSAVADLTDVMISSQKASVSFQALTQVRNKLVQAYQDIMQMPV